MKEAGHPALQTLPTLAQARRDPEKAHQRALVLLARLEVEGVRKDPTALSPRKLSTAAALNRGADVIVREAPKILELLALYASDPESPHHTWALQLFADRILPQRAFAALAIKEAGLEEKSSGATPRVTINVIAGGPSADAGSGRIIEVVAERSDDGGERNEE